MQRGLRKMQRACNVIRESMALPVVALLLAQVREVVEARPIPRPLALAPIIGLGFGFLFDGGFSRERVEGCAFLRLGGVVVGVGVGDVGVDVFHG